MININKLKKVKSNFPVMVGKGAISKKDCEKLIDEIRNAKSFDDLIQGGRNRINKGSSNFKNYLLPPTITGGLPPSDPGSPGTTCVLPSHLSRNSLKRT